MLQLSNIHFFFFLYKTLRFEPRYETKKKLPLNFLEPCAIHKKFYWKNNNNPAVCLCSVSVLHHAAQNRVKECLHETRQVDLPEHSKSETVCL